MDIFLHPWFMVAGGALVSSPIIIHLINRMRFKRIRWAAMEFLLKSQKRNRRRLIIEQMILLLLRILLVLLAAFLVARFIYGSGAEKLTEAVDKLVGANINLSLIDTALPSRGKTRQVALNHDNVAITDLRAETRVAPVELPIEFTVTIENFGTSPAKRFLRVWVDGEQDFGAEKPLPNVKVGRNEEKFNLMFAKKKET